MQLIKALKKQADLTPLEIQIAEYILENLDGCLHMSANELGSATYTSGSTVTRLAQKLGCSGFSEFKLALAAEIRAEQLNTSIEDYNAPFEKNDPRDKVVEKLAYQNVAAILDTQSAVPVASLQRAAQILQQAESIDFYGSGISFFMCQNAAENFRRIGVKCACYSDAAMIWSNVNTVGRKTASVIVSYSGISKTYQALCLELKSRGSKVITITGVRDNPVSLLGTVNLGIQSEEKNFKIMPLTSRTSTMYLLDCLYALYFHTHYDENMAFLKSYGGCQHKRHLDS